MQKAIEKRKEAYRSKKSNDTVEKSNIELPEKSDKILEPEEKIHEENQAKIQEENQGDIKPEYPDSPKSLSYETRVIEDGIVHIPESDVDEQNPSSDEDYSVDFEFECISKSEASHPVVVDVDASTAVPSLPSPVSSASL